MNYKRFLRNWVKSMIGMLVALVIAAVIVFCMWIAMNSEYHWAVRFLPIFFVSAALIAACFEILESEK